MSASKLKYLAMAVLLTCSIALHSQTRRDSVGRRWTDSTFVNNPDSLRRADSLDAARRDSLDLLKKSSLERPAFTTAKDSIITDFSDGKRMIYYYGGATVEYQNMKLTADYIEYDMLTNTVFARGQKDPATGEWKGQPEMTEGGQQYKMEELRYNFDTQKARITNMITKESEGLLQGKKIKMMPDKSINMQDGVYTVCDLEEPHYYLRLSMAKVVTKPSQKTVFGPAWPVVAGVLHVLPIPNPPPSSLPIPSYVVVFLPLWQILLQVIEGT